VTRLTFACISLILPMALVGCSMGSLRVSSTPDKADVMMAYEGEQPSKLGQTPLHLDSRMIESRRGSYVTLYVKKDGYQTESVMIPTSLFQSSVDVSTRLEEFKL